MLTGGGPGTTTYTASFYLYQIGFQQFHLSRRPPAAGSFFLLLAVVIIVLVRRLLKRRRRNDEDAPVAEAAQSRRAGLARAFTIGLFVIFVLVPLYWVVITSIKPSSDYLTIAPGLVPGKTDDRALHGRALLLSRACRGSSTA